MEQPYTSNHPVLRIAAACLLVGLIIAAIIVPLMRHNQATMVTPQQLSVVAAENFWGNIASQIGGKHVHITSIITDPEADPHLYESNATNAREIAQADVVITNGLGYDDFIDKLISSSQSNQRRLLTAAQILKVSGDQANPHLWYDIPRLPEVADAITRAFSAKDPQHKADYQANLKTFNDSLQPLMAQLRFIKQTYQGQPVAYTERVAGYLLDDAGLDVKTPPGFTNAIEAGTDPSPADNQAMQALLTNRSIKALLYNSQAASPLTDDLQKLARQNDVPIVGVTETLPTSQKTYQSWQQSQLDSLAKALAAN